MGRLKIKFHPLFWIFLILICFSNRFLSAISYLICVFLHEFGHGLCAKILGYRLNKITFLPFGASISGKENVFYKPSHEIIVAISGPLVNGILSVICLAVFWLFPSLYVYLEDFYFANVTTLLFNFCPVYPLDGARVIFAYLKKKKGITRAYKTIRIIGFVISSILLGCFVASSFIRINYTLGLSSIFLFAGLFFEDSSSFYVTNFSFNSKSKKLILGMDTNVISIKEDAIIYNVLRKISKFKYNIIHIINKKGKIIKTFSEDEFDEIVLSMPLDSKISTFIK